MKHLFSSFILLMSLSICSSIVSAKSSNLSVSLENSNLIENKLCESSFLEANGHLSDKSNNGWVSRVNPIGYRGIESSRVSYRNIDIAPSKRTFELSFNMTSTQCNKMVFIGLHRIGSNKYLWGDWIFLEKGKNKRYNRFITLPTNDLQVKDLQYLDLSFEFGGFLSVSSDFDPNDTYSFSYSSTDGIILDEDGKASTTIKCSNIYFGPKINKPKSKIKKIVKSKKRIKIYYYQFGVTKYQIKYSTSKKFKNKNTKKITTKKSTYSFKYKKSKKYHIKVRSIKKPYNRTIYGKWSPAKII